MKQLTTLTVFLMLSTFASTLAVAANPNSSPEWRSGLPDDPDYFPIGVWLQDPRLAEQYKQIGINLYLGLWGGPKEEQLVALRKAGMPIICTQNDYARELLKKNDPLLETVVGWMHQDEPDNAQRKPEGGGYGPPVSPATIIADYQRLRQADPTRPVYLNLSQGVAWDQWVGRGVRSNKPEDYPEYAKGADILSFDIYPASSSRAIKGELWRVGYGVKRLKEWAQPGKPVWAFIECTRIHGAGKATPDEVRAMVWMALVNGATGIQYFVHEWDAKGKMVSASQLLRDPEMRDAVGRINRQIHELAPVLNRPSETDAVTIRSSSGEVPIEAMVKRTEDAVYLFAVAMRGVSVSGEFRLRDLAGQWNAEVIGEDRTLAVTDGLLKDDFAPWGVHLYRLTRAEAAR